MSLFGRPWFQTKGPYGGGGLILYILGLLIKNLRERQRERRKDDKNPHFCPFCNPGTKNVCFNQYFSTPSRWNVSSVIEKALLDFPRCYKQVYKGNLLEFSAFQGLFFQNEKVIFHTWHKVKCP
jgi:hypothetical protein